MGKTTRATQKLFGSTAGSNQMAEFGSFAAGVPARYSGTTITPAIIQSLSNYLEGWLGAVDGFYSPTVEDMNAICFLYSYQIFYILEMGIAEWDAGTTYYTGSIVNSGGTIYVSKTDDNTNNALTSTANWRPFLIPQTISFKADGTFTVPTGCTQVQVTATKKVSPFPDQNYGNFFSVLPFILQDGTAYATGQNPNGQIGNGTVVAQNGPALILEGLAFKKVYVDFEGENCYGLTKTGDLYGWGLNASGSLGVGDTTPRSSPVLVLGGLKFMDMVAGQRFGIGLTEGGAAYAWGLNNNGQLGVGDVTPRSSPVAVLGGLTFKRIYAADLSVGALTTAGAAYMWGANADGRLGVGDVVPRSSPVAVLGGLTFQKLRTGAYGSTNNGVSMGLTTAGALYSWGFNNVGQLGVGDVNARSSPVAVLGVHVFTDFWLSVNPDNAYGYDGSQLYGWGSNTIGQVGDGTIVSKSSPVAVLGSHSVSTIAICPGALASESSVLLVDGNGTLYSWGDNTFGQLGLGDVVARSSPVAVLSGLTVTKASNLQGTFYAADVGGKLYGWGQGPNGVGDATPRSSPVVMLGIPVGQVKSIVESQTIIVTPGQTYPVKLSNFLASFGNTVVSSGVVDTVDVAYSS